MSDYKKLCTLCLCLLGMLMPVAAQTNTPYSRYGYGILDDNAFSHQKAMGGVGYASRTKNQINVMNPASYTSMDSLTFLFDFGLSFQNQWVSEGDARGQVPGGGLDYLSMQFPLGRYMAGSIGLLPFSAVGYSFGATGDNGSTVYSGDGGISQAYIGVAGTPVKGLSLGVNIAYLFGSTVNQTQVDPDGASVGIFQTEMSVTDFRFQFGLQYSFNINPKNSFTIGAVYSPAKKIYGEFISVKNNANSTDTINHGYMDKRYSLPHMLGAGLSYTYDQRLTIEADFSWQNWASAKFYNPDTESDQAGTLFSDRMKLSLGAEYRPSLFAGGYMKHIRYRLGAFYNRSYLKIKGNNLDEFGVSCGFGLPMRNDKTMLNLSFEYIDRNTQPTSLVREQALRISLGITFNEMWFWKRRFE